MARTVRANYLLAAVGKIGAFVGTQVFPYIVKAGKNPTTQNQYPFWVASSLCILSACLALFCLPHIGQDTITKEDIAFRGYLESKGWDTNQLGLIPEAANIEQGEANGTAPIEVVEKSE